MIPLKAIVAVLAILFFAGGCATAGRPSLNPITLINITERNATFTEVQAMLGKPDDAVTGANGKTLISYIDGERDWRLLKGEVGFEFRSAYFLFNDAGVLERKLVSETGTKLVSKGSVATVGRPITEGQIERLAVQKSRFEEVVEILGHPLVEALTVEGDVLRQWVFTREATFSKSGSQTLTGFFDYDRDILMDFVIRDDLPADKKKVATE
jgi:hypothetical protein